MSKAEGLIMNPLKDIFILTINLRLNIIFKVKKNGYTL